MKKSTLSLVLLITLICAIICSGTAAYADTTPFIDNPEAISDASYSVVMLYCYDSNGELVATGSGFAAIENGIFITNFHVIEGCSSIVANTEGGLYFDISEILATDSVNDIAILKTNARTGMTILPFGSAYGMLKGSKVIAIGSPKGFINSVSSGLCSGVIKDFGIDYIQFDASISPGSSGGALFNNNGEVIGITSAYYTEGNNLNLAVPIERVSELWNKYQSGEAVVENTQTDEDRYSLADSLYEEEKYEEAREIYLELGSDFDVRYCDANIAVNKILEGTTIEASDALYDLQRIAGEDPDFSDILESAEELLYNEAVDNYHEGYLAAAAKLFEPLLDADYKDSYDYVCLLLAVTGEEWDSVGERLKQLAKNRFEDAEEILLYTYPDKCLAGKWKNDYTNYTIYITPLENGEYHLLSNFMIRKINDQNYKYENGIFYLIDSNGDRIDCAKITSYRINVINVYSYLEKEEFVLGYPF